MFSVNYRELHQMYRSMGATACCAQLQEWFELTRTGQSGGLRPEEFSIRQLAEAIVGREWVESLNPANINVIEAGETVDSTAFANITGQLIYSAVMSGYMRPEFVFTSITPTLGTRLSDGEKIPGVANLTDDVTDTIPEGREYPHTGFGEDWVTTPALEKRGRIVAVTREAVFSDRTGQVLRTAGSVGELLGTRKEKRLVDAYIGVTNNYNRQGTSYNTYLTSGAWVNDHSNPLVDWTDVDNARQLFSNMTDPNTGEPIMMSPTTVIAVPGNIMAARRVFNATEIRFGDGASGTTQTVSANPVAGAFRVLESQLMYARLQSELSVSASNAKQYWLNCDPTKFVSYMQGWPITVSQAPTNSTEEFNRDVVAQYKASEFGVPAIMEPRASVRNKN